MVGIVTALLTTRGLTERDGCGSSEGAALLTASGTSGSYCTERTACGNFVITSFMASTTSSCVMTVPNCLVGSNSTGTSLSCLSLMYRMTTGLLSITTTARTFSLCLRNVGRVLTEHTDRMISSRWSHPNSPLTCSSCRGCTASLMTWGMGRRVYDSTTYKHSDCSSRSSRSSHSSAHLFHRVWGVLFLPNDVVHHSNHGEVFREVDGT